MIIKVLCIYLKSLVLKKNPAVLFNIVIWLDSMSAFAKTEKGGNPAGVVFDADNLSESEMKAEDL
jgi:hypothetical protein